ncbi:Na+/H+ antiporter subunit E [Kocuria sp. CPCC 205292]|uniref:Na+/H+ antiporter subunit E n=1 Tax=Kocuria cellulosilytica TaxID=3071451 RepID=UPI0034D3FD71
MKWVTWLPRIVGFLLWFAREVLVSNLAVMHDVFTVQQRSSPIVVRCRSRCRTEFETATLAVLISLTPGTLTLATAARAGGEDGLPPGHDLYVHVMYDNDPDSARRRLREFETRLLRAVRAEGAPP